MRTVWFVSRVSLFALLIVGVCCFPAKKVASHGGGYPNVAPGSDSNLGGTYDQYSPGDVSFNTASEGVSNTYNQPMAQMEPSFSSRPVRRPAAAAPVVYTPTSGNVDYRGRDSVRREPPSSLPAGSVQPYEMEPNWLVKPKPFGNKELSPGSRGADFSSPENVSPPLPVPEYVAGELSHYQENLEHGDYESETEEQGPPSGPPPMMASSEPSFTSEPRPDFRGWRVYPYYDYLFLTGQYPPGTVSHASSSYEHGSDSWHDAHYVRDYIPYYPGPTQQVETVFEALKQPVKSPAVASGQDVAQPPLPAPSRYAMQPSWFQPPTPSQAGGYRVGKV